MLRYKKTVLFLLYVMLLNRKLKYLERDAESEVEQSSALKFNIKFQTIRFTAKVTFFWDNWRTMAQNLKDFQNSTRVLTRILEGYDLRLRPNLTGGPVQVGLAVTIASFDSISEVNMDFTVTFYLNQYWNDDRLAFSTSDEVINLQGDFANKIWVPDIMLSNDKNSFLHDIVDNNKMVRLRGDGEIIYGMRVTSTLACTMDLHNYPMDSQKCAMDIESYGYTINDMLIYWKGQTVFETEKSELGQFSILNYDVDYFMQELPTGTYERLVLGFEMQRNIGYFVYHNYLPCILIVKLSWVSFWINHEATSARVALGITTVLTMTTINTSARSSMPRISYVKAIDIYMVVCFAFVFAALLEYSAVNHTYWGIRAKKRRGKNKKKSTECTNRMEQDRGNMHEYEMTGRQETSEWSSPKARGRASHAGRQKQPKEYRKPNVLQNLRQKVQLCNATLPKINDVRVIDKYSRVFFPIAFVLFNVAYFGFYNVIKITRKI